MKRFFSRVSCPVSRHHRVLLRRHHLALILQLAIRILRMSSPSNGIVVVGCVSDASFHRCCRLVRVLNDSGISARVTSMPLYETQWEEYLKEKKTQVGGRIFEVRRRWLTFG